MPQSTEFAHIPIWIRVSKLPLGMMNRMVGEAIGEEVGEFVEMEKEDDGSAVGRFMRIKVRIDICKPLMRGVTLNIAESNKDLWCPLVYEYLPDFCYIYGIIGHVDKACSTKLQKGEAPQFGKHLRLIPEKRRSEEYVGDRFRGTRNSNGWRSGSGGSRNSFGGMGSCALTTRGGSDAPSGGNCRLMGRKWA